MSDDAYLFEEDGVKWTVTIEKGEISYRGLDKDGKEVTMPPSSVIKAAENHDFSQGKGAEIEEKLAREISNAGYEAVVVDEGAVIGIKNGERSEKIDSVAVSDSLINDMNKLGVDSYAVQSKVDNSSDDVRSHQVDSVTEAKAEEEAEKKDKKGEGRSPSENQEKREGQSNSLEDAMPKFIRGDMKPEDKSGGVHCMRDVIDDLRGVSNKAVTEIVRRSYEKNRSTNRIPSGRGPRTP
jgi:hypothetical protein